MRGWDDRSRGAFGIWWFWHAVIGILSATAVILMGMLAVDQIAESQTAIADARNYTPPPIATAGDPASSIPTVQAAVKELSSDPKQAWNLTVIGDSTGAGSGRWVRLTATALSAKFHRPVLVHDWNVDRNRYDSQTEIGKGEPNAQITVWNGSASGQNPGYSAKYFKQLAPEQPNLVIINHGHNCFSTGQAVDGITQLRGLVNQTWPKMPALAVTLQNPRLDSTRSTQDQVVSAVRAAFANNDKLTEIDVNTAFRGKSLSSLLLPDGRHPSDAGDALWESVVAKSFGIA